MRRRFQISSGARRRHRCWKPPPSGWSSSSGSPEGMSASQQQNGKRRPDARWRDRPPSATRTGHSVIAIEPLGRCRGDPIEADRVALNGRPVMRRLRMIPPVARQGFARCARSARSTRRRRRVTVDAPSLEPLLPGFLSASAAMTRVVEADVHVAGEQSSRPDHGRERDRQGTGVARHSRRFHRSAGERSCIYNCTTTAALADVPLFGHRRGSFTGAVTDQPGLIRTASGGTLFLDEKSATSSRRSAQTAAISRAARMGKTNPQRVDVRVIAATNADLEQLRGQVSRGDSSTGSA